MLIMARMGAYNCRGFAAIPVHFVRSSTPRLAMFGIGFHIHAMSDASTSATYQLGRGDRARWLTGNTVSFAKHV
jgi:hypothetical protein